MFKIILTTFIVLLSSCVSDQKEIGVLAPNTRANLKISTYDEINNTATPISGAAMALGEVKKGKYVLYSFILENKGNLKLTDLKVEFVKKIGAFSFKPYTDPKDETIQIYLYPGAGGTCKTSLDKDEKCTINLQFYSEKSGVMDDNLKISFIDGIDKAEMIIPFSATSGDPSVLSFDDTPSDFGVYEPLSSISKIITVTNISGLAASDINASLDISSTSDIVYKGGLFPNLGVFPGVGGTCGGRLESGASCTIALSFNPLAYGVSTTTLNLFYFNGDGVNQLTNSFTATSAEIRANVRFDRATPFNFEDSYVGVIKKFLVTVINAGFDTATDVTYNVSPPFKVGTSPDNTCTNILKTYPLPNICVLEIEFDPSTASPGTYSQNIMINYRTGKKDVSNNFIYDNSSLALNGKILKPGVIKFSGNITSFNYGIVANNNSSKIQVILQNTGDLKMTGLNLSALTLPFTLVTNSCGTTLNKASSCFIEVKFNPTAAGSYSDVINFIYNNSVSVTSQSVTFTGQGQDLALLEDNLNPIVLYPIIAVNGKTNKTIKVSNIGTVAATNVLIANLAIPFEFQTTGLFPGAGSATPRCPAVQPFTLAALSFCYMDVTFAPTASNPSGLYTLNTSYFNGANNISFDFTLNASSQVPNLGYWWSSGNLITCPAGFSGGTSCLARTNVGSNSRTFRLRFDNPNAFDYINVNNTLPANFIYSGGSYPGVGGTCTAGGTIPAFGFCEIDIRFNPQTAGNTEGDINVSYSTAYGGSYARTIKIGGVGGAFPVLSLSPSDPFSQLVLANAPVGSFRETGFTLTNIGDAPTSSTDAISVTGIAVSSYTVNSNTCTSAPLAPGNSCTFNLRFTPLAANNVAANFTINYADDSANTFSIFQSVNAQGRLSGLLTLTGAPTFDFGSKTIGQTFSQNIIIKNANARFQVTSINVTDSADVSVWGQTGPITSLFSDYTCISGSLNGGAQCTMKVKFSPTVPDVIVSKLFKVNYFDGINNQSISITVKGSGQFAPSTHNGWSNIYAVGGLTTTAGATIDNATVKISWPAMTAAPGATIVGYNIYKTSTSGSYSSVVALNETTPISTSSRSWTDTNVSPEEVAYYLVKPYVDVAGVQGTSGTLESFSEIQVNVPPVNMALVHRWMANKYTCAKMGQTSDPFSNFSCSYTGIGNISGRYDIVNSLLVDRLELGYIGGVNYISAGATPYNNLTASQANSRCQLMTVTVDGNTIAKKLPSKMQFHASALWSDLLTDTTIAAREIGDFNTSDCNGNSSSIEITGNNTDCVSRFGIYDMAGNAKEWTTDILVNGSGTTNSSYKLDVTNIDFDSQNISGLTANEGVYNTTSCFNIPAGVLLPKSGGSCPAGSILANSYAATVYHNDFYSRPGSGFASAVMGGGFQNNEYSGVYTTMWITPTASFAGGRCYVEIP